MSRRPSSRTALAWIAALACVAGGCGGDDPRSTYQPSADEARTLTIYSGRNERLIGPLIERFSEQTGIDVQVRYGGTAEMVATLMEEGAYTPADLFLSQDAAALGALSRHGMLRAIPQPLLEKVPVRFRSPRSDWVGISGRARVVVYNTERIDADQLPRTLEETTDPRFRGRFGVAPTNASFQAHLAVYRALKGEQQLATLLTGMVANEPLRYPKNSPIVEAVINGEIDWGLVNHYYTWRALMENPDAPISNWFMPGGDASSFINLAGAALLGDRPEAAEMLEFLLGEEAQRYFAVETYEYPLVLGAQPAVELPPIEDMQTPDLDFGDVSDALEATLGQIETSGLTRF